MFVTLRTMHVASTKVSSKQAVLTFCVLQHAHDLLAVGGVSHYTEVRG